MRRAAMLAIRLYQRLAPPSVRRACRFTPSCSEFAHEAIERHGIVRGARMAAARLARCHPLGKSGLDPVP
jgi:putative membrane protein insertion efficiency factor